MTHSSDFLCFHKLMERNKVHPLSLPYLNEFQDKWLSSSCSGFCFPFQSLFVCSLYPPLILSSPAILNVFHPCVSVFLFSWSSGLLFPPFEILLSVHSTPCFHLLLSQHSLLVLKWKGHTYKLDQISLLVLSQASQAHMFGSFIFG